MKAINCPKCGAPAKIEAASLPVYTCPYCGQSFKTGAPEPKPNSPPPVQKIIVVAPGTSAPGRSAARMSAMISAFVAVIVLGSAVYGVVIARAAQPGGFTLPGVPAWDGTSAFECGGNDSVTLTGITTTLPGTAIIAGGNCHVKLVDCHVKADTVIEAGGNAEVRLQNGSYEGTVAIDAGGNSVIRIAGAKITGKKKHHANARIDGN